MFHKLIKYFKIQLKICNWFLLTPYEWPNESDVPIVHRSKVRWHLYRLNLYLHWIYLAAMSINFFLTLKEMTLANKLLGLIFLDCFRVTMSLRTVLYFKEIQGLTMIASYLEFEDQNPEAKTKKADVMGKLLMILGIVTSFGLPGLMMTILLADPCKPPHLGYILYNSAKGCQVPSGLTRFWILIFDYYMWTSSIAPACYYVFHFFALGLRCMEHYVLFAMRLLRSSTTRGYVPSATRLLPLPKPSSAQPQPPQSSSISPASNKHTDIMHMRIQQRRTLEPRYSKAFYIYRQIHLLNKLYDGVLQAVFIPSIISTACLAIIISLYACIKLHRTIPMPGFAFFPLLASDGFSVIFIVKVAAGVLNQSTRFLQVVRNNWKYSNKTLFKKVAKSLGKIKVRFGSTNFIDQLTPFVFIDFCLTQTVNMMLLR